MVDEQKHREGRYRFPYAGPGIRTYTKTTGWQRDPNSLEAPWTAEESLQHGLRKVADATKDYKFPEDMTPEQAERGRRMGSDYKTNIKYYYLGWLLEGIRFSLWDLNRDKVKRGETPFNVRFRYMDVPDRFFFSISFSRYIKDGITSFYGILYRKSYYIFKIKLFT